MSFDLRHFYDVLGVKKELYFHFLLVIQTRTMHFFA